MKAVAIVGQSQTGKTNLICRLIPELKKRGRSVFIIKHCAHGFILDLEGKDSWRFSESGADGVAMVGPNGLAIIKKEKAGPDFPKIASRYFAGADFVILEAGTGVRGLKKIEVLGKEFTEKPASASRDLMAVVSEKDLPVPVPRFHPLQIKEIADFLELSPDFEEPRK